MHKNKVLLSLLFILSVMFIGCDKGEDTVNFSYIRDSYDPRIYHFKAKGNSDYGSFSYKWDFGDGNVAAGEVASFAFETYGSHLVTLTADISKSGIHTSVSKNILVEIPKIENMDFVYAVSKSNPKEYYFEADAKSDFGTIDYEWNFGNNNIDTGKRLTINFDDYGFHEIKLNATLKESEEVTTELVKSIEIPTPEIRNLKFTYKIDSNDPRVVYFVAESDTTFGTVNYRWDFGNGDMKAGKEVSSMFTDYGKKTIKLTAELVELKQTVYREDTINVTPPLKKIWNLLMK